MKFHKQNNLFSSVVLLVLPLLTFLYSFSLSSFSFHFIFSPKVGGITGSDFRQTCPSFTELITLLHCLSFLSCSYPSSPSSFMFLFSFHFLLFFSSPFFFPFSHFKKRTEVLLMQESHCMVGEQEGCCFEVFNSDYKQSSNSWFCYGWQLKRRKENI